MSRAVDDCWGFQLIYKDEDKNNANLNRAMMGRFRRFINDLALKEIPLHGRKFTWSNQQVSPTLVKLDRVLCTVDWEDIFPVCYRVWLRMIRITTPFCLVYGIALGDVVGFILSPSGPNLVVFRKPSPQSGPLFLLVSVLS